MGISHIFYMPVFRIVHIFPNGNHVLGRGNLLFFPKNMHPMSVSSLVLKRISSQFHILFDDFFQSVRSVMDESDPVLTDFDWDYLITPQYTEEYIELVDRDRFPDVHHE